MQEQDKKWRMRKAQAGFVGEPPRSLVRDEIMQGLIRMKECSARVPDAYGKPGREQSVHPEAGASMDGRLDPGKDRVEPACAGGLQLLNLWHISCCFHENTA
jgi:hypothetical protein